MNNAGYVDYFSAYVFKLKGVQCLITNSRPQSLFKLDLFHPYTSRWPYR